MGGTWKRALVSDVLAANLACDACHVLEVVLCAAIDRPYQLLRYRVHCCGYLLFCLFEWKRDSGSVIFDRR